MKAVRWKLQTTQVIVSESKSWQSSIVTLMFGPQNVSCSQHPSSMYEIWKLFVENHSSYRVRTKVLRTFRCDLDLLTPKCIVILLSPPCVYVWNTKAVRWKLLKLSWQNQSVEGQTDKPDSCRARWWRGPDNNVTYSWPRFTVCNVCHHTKIIISVMDRLVGYICSRKGTT